jgi:hypothetical protein
MGCQHTLWRAGLRTAPSLPHPCLFASFKQPSSDCTQSTQRQHLKTAALAGPESGKAVNAVDTMMQPKGWKQVCSFVGPALLLPLADPIMSAMDMWALGPVRNVICMLGDHSSMSYACLGTIRRSFFSRQGCSTCLYKWRLHAMNERHFLGRCHGQFPGVRRTRTVPHQPQQALQAMVKLRLFFPFCMQALSVKGYDNTAFFHSGILASIFACLSYFCSAFSVAAMLAVAKPLARREDISDSASPPAAATAALCIAFMCSCITISILLVRLSACACGAANAFS